MEARELYLAQGMPSMFQYLRARYNYAVSGVCRRTAAARVLKDFPEVRIFLEDRSMNITVLSLLGKNMTKENCAELLELATGKSKRDVAKMLVERGDQVPGVARIAQSNNNRSSDFDSSPIASAPPLNVPPFATLCRSLGPLDRQSQCTREPWFHASSTERILLYRILMVFYRGMGRSELSYFTGCGACREVTESIQGFKRGFEPLLFG